MNCAFCKIAMGEIPSKKLYEDDHILAFYDLEPLAPVHCLIIPKAHCLESIDGVTEETAPIICYIFAKIPALAKLAGLENGYRIVTNCGADAGQTVNHLHFHLLGGTLLGPQA